ncbi:MAG: hypothetical protein Q9222_003403 [Ikaeria aurantiellina]
MDTTVIVDGGDLIVEVTELDYNTLDADKKPTIFQTHNFRVLRDTLANASLYFNTLLRAGGFKETSKDMVELKDDSVAAMKIWFQILHHVKPDHLVPLVTVWNVAAAGKKYGLEMGPLSAWFADWYDGNRSQIDLWYSNAVKENKVPGIESPCCLLYPCFLFDHWRGFRRVTEFCAYNFAGGIEEVNPTRHRDLRLPHRVSQQINAAKSRLRTVIHRELYNPNDKLLQATCSCKEVTLYNYEKALTNIKVWPLEKIAQSTPMREIIRRLDNFSFEAKPNACIGCRQGYKGLVDAAQSKTRFYFDGLCLDCMDQSKSEDDDAAYFLHKNADGRRPGEMEKIVCVRGTHTQPGWCFSFMGRRERRDAFIRRNSKARYEGDSE